MKVRRSLLVLPVLATLALNSCYEESKPLAPSISELDDAQWLQMRDNALQAFADARNEFFDGIPSAYDMKDLTPKELAEASVPPEDADSIAWDLVEIDTLDEAVEFSPEDYGVAENIKQLSWEAEQTGDDSELITYLQEEGLYEKYQEVAAKYNIEQHAKNLSMRKKSIPASKFTLGNFIDADIFVKFATSSSASAQGLGFLTPGHWKHAAFMDNTARASSNNYFLVSSSNQTNTYVSNPKGAVGRVGYDKLDGYWTGSTEVAVHRVSRASGTQRRKAIEYASQFFGTPFSFSTNRESNDRFYCSKLVYRGWRSQGVELEPHKSSYTGIPWVKKLKHTGWKTKKVGFVKVAYPVYAWVWHKDMYVTPTDLVTDGDAPRLTSF